MLNAPEHQASKSIVSTLSKDLRKKHNTRGARVRTGDKVKIMRGSHKNKTGKVERVDVSKRKVFMTKIEIIKKDGTKTMVPLDPSNLMIIELGSDDKRRFKQGETKNGKETPKTDSSA